LGAGKKRASKPFSPTSSKSGLRNPNSKPFQQPTSNPENAILKPLERGPSNDLRRGEKEIPNTTFSDGCLGSHIDEERSEMRYVMRIAESSESSKF